MNASHFLSVKCFTAYEYTQKGKVNILNARPLQNFSNQRSQKLVTFTDTSQIHEIPPKPKRTRNVEKRSRTVPIPPPASKSEHQAQVHQLEQRISLTSIEDLQKSNGSSTPVFDSTKNLNPKEKDDLKKVRQRIFDFISAFKGSKPRYLDL